MSKFDMRNQQVPTTLYKGDSMLNYTEALRNGSITPIELGKFFNLYLKYNFDYPNLLGYNDDTQARVIASVFRKIGLINSELPYKEIYEFSKRYIPKLGSGYNEILEKYTEDGILTKLQTSYVKEIITIINTSNFDDGSITNNLFVSSNLKGLMVTIQGDRSLTQKEMNVLISTITIIQNLELPPMQKPTSSVIFNEGSSINCKDCLWNHRHQISGMIAAAVALLVAASIGGLLLTAFFVGGGGIAALLGIGVFTAYVVVAATIAQYITWGVYKQYCGVFCADHREGIIECNVCPWYTHFFDGANCYLGWYASNHMGWIYGDAFWYKGDTVAGCNDGYLTPAWGYAPFNGGGHGVNSGGGACLFGYNYDTSYVPWVSSTGFYLKPHCEGKF
ncbi:MAG: hypothetical protein K9G49_16060 [Taibaiella sp.]|nr:hypothetical protein [Taibaiella sp.]